MLRVWSAANGDASRLQGVDPRRAFAGGNVVPLVEFLQQYLQHAKGGGKEGDGGVAAAGCIGDPGGPRTERQAELVNVVAESPLRDGPRGGMMSLEGRDNTAQDGRGSVAVVVDAPVKWQQNLMMFKLDDKGDNDMERILGNV